MIKFWQQNIIKPCELLCTLSRSGQHRHHLSVVHHGDEIVVDDKNSKEDKVVALSRPHSVAKQALVNAAPKYSKEGVRQVPTFHCHGRIENGHDKDGSSQYEDVGRCIKGTRDDIGAGRGGGGGLVPKEDAAVQEEDGWGVLGNLGQIKNDKLLQMTHLDGLLTWYLA